MPTSSPEELPVNLEHIVGNLQQIVDFMKRLVDSERLTEESRMKFTEELRMEFEDNLKEKLQELQALARNGNSLAEDILKKIAEIGIDTRNPHPTTEQIQSLHNILFK